MPRITIPEGWIDIASWCICLQGNYEAVERYLFSPELAEEDYEDYQRCFQSFVALQHLTIPFWQAISTSFVFFYSADYVALCIQAVSDFTHSQKRDSDVPYQKLGQEFTKLTARLQGSDAELTAWLEAADAKLQSGSWHRWERTEPVPRFTTTALQVIEDCAALCAYRICYPTPSHEEFLHYLDRHHFGCAYLLATGILGELAFDLFAPACYLALHAKEDPGRILEAILLYVKERLPSASREQIIEDPLTFLLNVTNWREEDCFPLVLKRAMSQGGPMPCHPILQPYLENFVQTPDDLRVSDFFARPYYYHTKDPHRSDKRLKKHVEFLTNMLPPAQVYANDVGRCLRAGLGKRLGDKHTQKIVELTTIVSLAERLVLGKREPMFCPHHACPVHKTGLCQGYFAFPSPPDDWRKCQFPEFLKELKLESLFESIPN